MFLSYKNSSFLKFLKYLFIRINKLYVSIFFFKSYELLLKGVYPSSEHENLFKNLQECDSIIDVGLNKGQFSLIACNKLPNIPLFGFEPIDKIYFPFQKYFKKRFPKRTLLIFPYALSDKEKISSFYITEKNDCSSLLEPSNLGLQITPNFLKIKKELKIETKRLDNILINNFKSKNYKKSLLKIDTQGSELSVLMGAKNILKSHIKYVYIEVSDLEHYKNQNKSKDIIAFLGKLGFINIFKLNISYNNKNLCYADYLFEKTS